MDFARVIQIKSGEIINEHFVLEFTFCMVGDGIGDGNVVTWSDDTVLHLVAGDGIVGDNEQPAQNMNLAHCDGLTF